MDRDERLIQSIVRQRQSRGRPLWARQDPAVVAVAALLAIALLALVRASLERGVSAPAATDSTATAPISAVAPTPIPASAGQASAATPIVAGAVHASHYVVQAGDTLRSIAESHGIHADTLIAVNDLEDADLLQPGVELEVPPTDGRIYVVAAGESLREIAARYDLDLALLISANDVRDPDHIAVGMRLFIPLAH